jgi:hypothetical protein
MIISGPLSSLTLMPSWKEPKLVPLGFLIRCTGTEPCRVNRMCLCSDREGCDETSQLVMFSRSPKDHSVISITSSLLSLQKVGSLPWFRISKLEEFRNSTRASSVSLWLVLPHTMWCVLESHPYSHDIAQVLPVPLIGEDPWYHRAGMWNRQPTAFLPHLHYTLLGLQENPGSIKVVLFLVRIRKQGLSHL